jgi:hypothetical protein
MGVSRSLVRLLVLSVVACVLLIEINGDRVVIHIFRNFDYL